MFSALEHNQMHRAGSASGICLGEVLNHPYLHREIMIHHFQYLGTSVKPNRCIHQLQQICLCILLPEPQQLLGLCRKVSVQGAMQGQHRPLY
uniref:Uncharacterized protein n=1 Tax=Arundo donax TaxID=35708 RepID=A0A0A9E718_ARUDO